MTTESPPATNLVGRLKDCLGLTDAQIADILGVSVRAANKHARGATRGRYSNEQLARMLALIDDRQPDLAEIKADIEHRIAADGAGAIK